MKKILYILLVSLCCSAVMTSCTEEEITPIENSDKSGGGASDPK
jgi:hypothetical protein